MASLLLVPYSGRRRSSGGGATTVRRLLRKLRSTWRRSATGRGRSRRAAAVRFGYDPQSYAQNFDDGAAHSYLRSSGRAATALIG